MENATILLDLGGTVLDNPSIVEALASRLGCAPSDVAARELYSRIFSGMADAIRNGSMPFENVAGIHRQALLEMSRHGFEDVSGQSREICVETYGLNSWLFPEVSAVLASLKGAQARLFVASDNDFETLGIERTKHNLDAYFLDYWISEAAKAYKPAAGFIEGLRRFIPVRKHRCYFVGDTVFDVQCAKALGIRSVFVARQPSSEKADYVIKDLSALLNIAVD